MITARTKFPICFIQRESNESHWDFCPKYISLHIIPSAFLKPIPAVESHLTSYKLDLNTWQNLKFLKFIDSCLQVCEIGKKRNLGSSFYIYLGKFQGSG